jgi:hypothetical protein
MLHAHTRTVHRGGGAFRSIQASALPRSACVRPLHPPQRTCMVQTKSICEVLKAVHMSAQLQELTKLIHERQTSENGYDSAEGSFNIAPRRRVLLSDRVASVRRPLARCGARGCSARIKGTEAGRAQLTARAGVVAAPTWRPHASPIAPSTTRRAPPWPHPSSARVALAARSRQPDLPRAAHAWAPSARGSLCASGR